LPFTAADLVSAFPQLAVTIPAPRRVTTAKRTVHIGDSEKAQAMAQARGCYAKSAKDWFLRREAPEAAFEAGVIDYLAYRHVGSPPKPGGTQELEQHSPGNEQAAPEGLHA
jgi:hypothetical protein